MSVRSMRKRNAAGAVQRARLLAACATLGMLAAVFALACHVGSETFAGGSSAGTAGAALEGSRMWERFEQACEEGSFAFADVDGWERRDADDMPSWFQEEVGLPAFAGQVWMTHDCSVVGFSMDASSHEALECVSQLLLDRGWAGCESGVSGVKTFSKEGGTCTWLAVSCTQVVDATTSVCISLLHA